MHGFLRFKNEMICKITLFFIHLKKPKSRKCREKAAQRETRIFPSVAQLWSCTLLSFSSWSNYWGGSCWCVWYYLAYHVPFSLNLQPFWRGAWNKEQHWIYQELGFWVVPEGIAWVRKWKALSSEPCWFCLMSPGWELGSKQVLQMSLRCLRMPKMILEEYWSHTVCCAKSSFDFV